MAPAQHPSRRPHMGRIEDAHMIVCHMIRYYFYGWGEVDTALHD